MCAIGMFSDGVMCASNYKQLPQAPVVTVLVACQGFVLAARGMLAGRHRLTRSARCVGELQLAQGRHQSHLYTSSGKQTSMLHAMQHIK